MFFIKIADITVQIHNVYPFVERFCKDYRVDPVENPDLIIGATTDEIVREVELEGATMPPEQAEGICLYRKICVQLPIKFQGFLMHCAVIEYEGVGYAFAAKSGTGKSTHIALWQKHFGNAVHIVNGDKPIMRFRKNQLYAYGTPWCGKEGFQTNTSVPMKAICFIERSETNQIRPIGPDEAVTRIFHQILTPSDLETVNSLFPLLDQTLREIPCYVLGCNISEEAAQVAYHGMNKI
ncbi:MAG: hypothetical protein IJY47_01600 [Clostridia bacterium]|nr:hypothetical protein [Clostridia bacterium]